MQYEIKRANAVVATVKPTGKVTSKIMGEELATLSFTLLDKVEFAKYDYITFKGRIYSIMDSYSCIQKSTREWQYNIVFKSVKYRLNEVSMLFYDEANELTVPSSFLVATAQVMVEHVVTNANRLQSGWTVGTIDATETKNVQFDDLNCLSALAKIAEEFKLEYWIDADKSIHFTERKPTSGTTLQYGQGKGLKSLTQQPLGDSAVVTRLRVKGSEKNLPQNYRNGQKNLRMDVPYLEKNTDKYGTIEHTETFEEVYPHRIGTVTAIDANNHFVFTDADIDFDLNATDSHGNTTVLIKGLSAKVVFQTGQLAGYRFEIKEFGYNSQTKTFTLLPNKDETAWDVPSSSVRPAVGDTYILEDIQMPATYVTNAETELKTKGQDYLDTNSVERFSFLGEADQLVFRELQIQPVLGSTIRIKSIQFNLDDDLRVTGMSEDLQEFYNIQLDFSEVAFLSPVVTKYYEQEKKQQQIIKEQKSNTAIARAAYYFARETADKTFDGEGYFNMQNFKAASIDTKLISLGGRMQQFSLPDVKFYLENNYTSLRNTAGQIIHLTIADEPRSWNITANTITPISNEYHYVYVKCQRVGNNATLWVSTDQILVEQDPDYFHFEAGYISSINNGYRIIKTNYGFAQLNPAELSIGRIADPSGNNSIELTQDSIIIKAKVEFTDDSPAYQQIKVGAHNLILKSDSTESVFKIDKENRPDILAQNLDYIFTAEIAHHTSIDASLYLVAKNITTDQYELLGYVDFHLIANIPQRIQIKQNIQLSNYDRLVVKVQNDDNNAIEISIKKPQLEQGNVASDYTLNQMDLVQLAKEAQEERIIDIENKTDFLSTDITGNVLATGTVLVGQDSTTNAGISGLNHDAGNSVRFWAGATFENRKKAPWLKKDNGIEEEWLNGVLIRRKGIIGGNYYDELYNPNGTLAKRTAIVDGKIIEQWYNNGTLVYQIGQGGIYYVSEIAESYSLRRLRNLNSNASTSDLTDFHTTIRQNMWQKTSNPQQFEFRGNQDAYDYNAGRNVYSESNKQYEGYKNSKSYYDNLADGWYAYEQLGWMMSDAINETQVIVELIRTQDGKIVQTGTTNVETQGYVFNQF